MWTGKAGERGGQLERGRLKATAKLLSSRQLRDKKAVPREMECGASQYRLAVSSSCTDGCIAGRVSCKTLSLRPPPKAWIALWRTESCRICRQGRRINGMRWDVSTAPKSRMRAVGWVKDEGEGICAAPIPARCASHPIGYLNPDFNGCKRGDSTPHNGPCRSTHANGVHSTHSSHQ
jgi:hypothetical protein